MNAVVIRVTSDQLISGYEVIGVRGQRGIAATEGIAAGNHMFEGLDIEGSDDGCTLKVSHVFGFGESALPLTGTKAVLTEWQRQVAPGIATGITLNPEPPSPEESFLVADLFQSGLGGLRVPWEQGYWKPETYDGHTPEGYLYTVDFYYAPDRESCTRNIQQGEGQRVVATHRGYLQIWRERFNCFGELGIQTTLVITSTDSSYETFYAHLRTIEIGSVVFVYNEGEGGLNLRQCHRPSTNDTQCPRLFMPNGTKMTVIDGPIRAEKYTWWKLGGYVNGVLKTGWAVESLGGELRRPKQVLFNSIFHVGDSVLIFPSRLRLRQCPSPSRECSNFKWMNSGTRMTIIGGPEMTTDGYIWWKLQGDVDGDGVQDVGWAAEADPSLPTPSSGYSRSSPTLAKDVVAGQRIGLVSDHGCAQSPHLHFAARRQRQWERLDDDGSVKLNGEVIFSREHKCYDSNYEYKAMPRRVTPPNPHVNISVTPASVNFGSIIVGQSSDQTITITNQPNSTGILNGSVGTLSSPFSVVSGGGSFSLSPGQSRSVVVRFSPTTSGSFSAGLLITHNATNQSSPINIPLSGTGGGGCTVTPINIGQTVSGSLSTGDCRSPVRGSSYYADRYSFSASAGQQVAILLTSSAFNTYLYLISPSGSVIAQDDDGGGGTNSRIPPGSGFYRLPSSGTYIIEVTSYVANSIGNYTLSLSGSTSCTYSISPTSQSFGAAGGSGTVTVTAAGGCSWIATSNASWITITSGNSGTGSGTVTYSVAANTSTSSRTGTLTIAGQPFTVTQAGASSPGVTVIDHTMTNVRPSTCTAPPRVYTFQPTDSVAYSWTYVSGVRSGDSVRWEWYMPNGTLYTTATYTLTFTGNGCFWAGIYIAGYPPASTPGNWSVRVFYNGAQIVTESFTITGSTGPTVNEVEPNDTPSQAQLIPVPSTVNGQASPGATTGNWYLDINKNKQFDPGVDDRIEDFYQFTLSQATTVSITLSVPNPSAANLDLYVTDSQLRYVGYSYGPGTPPETVTVSLAPGTYYIIVTNFDPGPTIPTSYTLRISR